METVSVNICSLCVPCYCRCRYCLLSWDGKILGADYERSKAYALRFRQWLMKNRPGMNFGFYWGYSMEHPSLLEEIAFLQKIGSPGGTFLQFDGMKMRTDAELLALIKVLKERGIRLLDLTYYGTEEYHDRFAARKGDFDLLNRTLKAANLAGLDVQAGVPVTKENVSQIDELLKALECFRTAKISLFIPHGEGRGACLDAVRLTESDFQRMSSKAQGLLNRSVYRTEGQWLQTESHQAPQHRVVTLSLTPENMGWFESQPFDQAIAYAESLDDRYHAAVPPFEALVQEYGDPSGTQLFRFRDLEMHYQTRYVQDHCLTLPDVHDERKCFIRRF